MALSEWSQIQNPLSAVDRSIEPIIIGDSITGDGSTTPIRLKATHDYNIYVFGTFDGASVTLEWSIDNITYTPFVINTQDLIFIAQGMQYFFKLDHELYIRATTATAGASTNLNVQMR